MIQAFWPRLYFLDVANKALTFITIPKYLSPSTEIWRIYDYIVSNLYFLYIMAFSNMSFNINIWQILFSVHVVHSNELINVVSSDCGVPRIGRMATALFFWTACDTIQLKHHFKIPSAKKLSWNFPIIHIYFSSVRARIDLNQYFSHLSPIFTTKHQLT